MDRHLIYRETTTATSAPWSGGMPMPKLLDPDRVCDEPECDTVLSRYNEDDHCWVHRRPYFGTSK